MTSRPSRGSTDITVLWAVMFASPILVGLSHPIATLHERPPVAAPRDAVERELHTAASREGVPYGLVRAVAMTESSLVSTAVSPTGAIGIMQIEPAVATDCGITNRFDVHANVFCGVRLLRRLLARYEWDIRRALMAYNFGPSAVDRVHRHHGEPPETKRYVASVLATMRENKE